MRQLIAVALVLILADCATPEQLAQQQQARAAQYQQGLINTCSGYGFQQGTPEFSNCMTKLDQANQNALDSVLRQQELRNMNQPGQIYQPPRPPPRQ